MPLANTSPEFANFVELAIRRLPQDLKQMLRVFDDPDLEDDDRVRVAGVILHTLSGANVLPGLSGTLAYFDDALLLRMLMFDLGKRYPDLQNRLVTDLETTWEAFGIEIEQARTELGESDAAALDKALTLLPKAQYKGQHAQQAATDDEAAETLYDTVQEQLTESFDFDEPEKDRALRQDIAALRS